MKLEWQVNLSILIVVLAIGAASGGYFWHFSDFPKGNADSWGQFGDFIGGVINPLVAFGAFYWLTASVKLQKTELAETRAELARSHEAQAEHARTALLAAQIQTTNIKLSAISNLHNHHRNRRAALLAIMVSTDGVNSSIDETGGMTPLGVQLYQVNQEIERVGDMELSLVAEIRAFSDRLAMFAGEQDPNE